MVMSVIKTGKPLFKRGQGRCLHYIVGKTVPISDRPLEIGEEVEVRFLSWVFVTQRITVRVLPLHCFRYI